MLKLENDFKKKNQKKNLLKVKNFNKKLLLFKKILFLEIFK